MATAQDLIYNVTVNDTALDRLIAKTAELNSALFSSQAAMKPLDAQLRGLGRRVTEVGRFMTRSFTVPLLAAGAAASKMAFDFDKSMSRIQTLGGATAAEMEGLKKSVLDLASSTLTNGPQELADALYFIRSSGFGAAEGMKVLKASNVGAMIGMGDTKTVADAVTSAMNAYGHSTLSAARTVDIFAKTVELGKAEPAELAAAIGRVIPIAHQMGVSLAEVGGEIAAMTLQGLSAQSAVTGLRAVLTTFTKGLPITQKGLASIGLSIGGVQKAIREQGIAPTLNLIRQRITQFDTSGGKLFPNLMRELKQFGPEGEKAMLKLEKASGNTAASLTSEIFPNVRALNSFLITTGKNAKTTAATIGGVRDSAGYAQEKFNEILKQNWAQFTLTWSRLRAELIKIGEAALPVFTKLMKLAVAFFHILDALGPVGQVFKSLIGQAAIFLVVIGPLLRLYGTLIRLSSVYVLRRGKETQATVALAAEDRAALQSVAVTSEATSAAIASMGTAMAGATIEIEAASSAADAAITTIGLSAVEAAAAMQGIGPALVEQTAMFDESVGEMTGQMTLLDIEVNKVKADLLAMGIVAKEAQAGGFMYMGTGGKFLKASEREAAQARMATVGEQMTLFDPRLFKGELAPALESAGTEAEVVAGKVGLLSRGMAGLRGGVLAATGAMEGFLAVAWPLIAIEGAILLWQNWDKVGTSIYNATGDLKNFVNNLPGAKGTEGFFKSLWGGLKHIPGVQQATDIFNKQPKWLKIGELAGVSPLAAFLKLAYDHGKKLHDELKKGGDAANKQKDYVAQVAKILGISVAEARRLLGLTKDTSAAFNKAAQAAKQAFEDAFGRLTEDIDTLFDATTQNMLDKFDATTQKLIDNMRVKVTVLGKTWTQKPDAPTPAERELAALQKATTLRQAYLSLTKAGRDIQTAIASGDPYALEQAQADAADARATISGTRLQDVADKQRKAVDVAQKKKEAQITKNRGKTRKELEAERTLEKRHLDDRLKSLETQLEKRQITIGVFNKKLRGLMGEYGVTASDGAKQIATAFGQQMQESLAGLATVIARHAKYLGAKHRELAAQAEAAAARVSKAWKTMADNIVKQADRAVKAIQTMTDAQGSYTGPAGGPNYGAGVGGAHGPGGPLGGSSTAYFGDVLGLLQKGTGKKLSAAQFTKTIAFFNMWAHQESVPQNVDPFNALGTSLPVGGSHPTNKYKVQAYKTWRDGVVATVKMLSQSNFRNLLMAVMSGDPLNYIATHKAAQDELQRWSGTWHGGYHNIKSGLSSAPLPIGNIKAAAEQAKAQAAGAGSRAVNTATFGVKPTAQSFAPYAAGGGFQVTAIASGAARVAGHLGQYAHVQGERMPYDCSAFAQAVFKQAGLGDIGNDTYAQFANGHAIKMSQLLPGDLVFFNYGSEKPPGHVAIYMGNGVVVHDHGWNPQGVKGIEMQSLSGRASGSSYRGHSWGPYARCFIKEHVHYSQGDKPEAGDGRAQAERRLQSIVQNAVKAAPAAHAAKAAASSAGGKNVGARALASAGGGGARFTLPGKHTGLLKPGNIDISHRQIVRNPDGSFSTVDTISISVDGHEVLIPKVVGGKVVSDEAAVKHYMKTGQNLGTFKGIKTANAYGVALHRQQAGYLNRVLARPIPGVPAWLQKHTHGIIRRIADLDVAHSTQAWMLAHHKGHFTPAQVAATTVPDLAKFLSPAEKKKLGPAGLQAWMQRMSAIASNPSQAGLITTHGGLPWTLGPTGSTGSVQNVNINIYEAGDPKKTAVEVRNQLQKHAKRNALSTRGRHIGEKVGGR